MKPSKVCLDAAALVLCVSSAIAGESRDWYQKALEAKDPAIQVADYTRAIEAWTPADGVPFKAILYYNRGLSKNDLPGMSLVEHAALCLPDMDMATSLDPTLAKAWYMRAESRRFDDSAKESRVLDYTKAIELDPNDALAFRRRGLAYGLLHQRDKQIADYDRAIALDPRSAQSFSYRAGALQFDQPESALKDYSRAVELEPSNQRYLLDRGSHLLYRLKDFPAAILDYSRLIELDPIRTLYYVCRATAHGYSKQDEAAIRDYTKAIEVDEAQHKTNPSHVRDMTIYSHRAKLYGAQKRLDLAEQDLNAAVRAATSDAEKDEAFMERVEFFVRQKKYQEAQSDLDATLKLVQKDYRRQFALSSRFEVYEKLGRFKEAEADIDAAIAESKSGPPPGLLWSRAQFYHRRGDLDRAERAFTDLALLDTKGYFAARLDANQGWISFQRGHLEKAGQWMAKALEAGKGEGVYLLALAAVEYRRGNRDLAKARWDEAIKLRPGLLKYLEAIDSLEVRQDSIASLPPEKQALRQLYEAWGPKVPAK